MFNYRMVRTSAVALAAGAVMFFMAGDAQAGGCGYGGYGAGYGGGYGGGVRISVGRGYGGYGGYGLGGYGGLYGVARPAYIRPPVWHDTTHLDYHPPRLVPHGNHLDRIPGHYHLHRSGHWD